MDDPPKITVHYIKAPAFEEIALHGVYGGVNVRGSIAMAIFTERMPIPNEMDMTLEPVEGQPGAFIAKEGATRGKEGIIRSVRGVLHFDVELAEVIRDWLDEKIKTAKGLKNG